MRLSSFNMSVIRNRAKKNLKRRHGKKATLTEIDSVIKDCIEYCIVQPLLKYGKVQVDKTFSLEIVGRYIADDNSMIALLSKGKTINGIVKDASNWTGRPGVKYKIVATETNYKGTLIFKADPKISKRVHERLKTTQQYYRIQTTTK